MFQKEKTRTVLQLLLNESLFGMELVARSEGVLARGSVYVTLGQMEEDGLITGQNVADSGNLIRRQYTITNVGRTRLELLR